MAHYLNTFLQPPSFQWDLYAPAEPQKQHIKYTSLLIETEIRNQPIINNIEILNP